eukprot:jgi/Ulvmu1/12329/UM089_0013.1
MQAEPSAAKHQHDVSELTRLLSECSARMHCQPCELDECAHTGTSTPIPIPTSTSIRRTTHNSLCNSLPVQGGFNQLVSSMIARPSSSASQESRQQSFGRFVCPPRTDALQCTRVDNHPAKDSFMPEQVHRSLLTQPVDESLSLFPAKMDCPLGKLVSASTRSCGNTAVTLNATHGAVPSSDKAHTSTANDAGVAMMPGACAVACAAQSGPWASAYSPFGSSPAATTSPQHTLASQVTQDLALCTSRVSSISGAPAARASTMELQAVATGLSGALFSLDEDLNIQIRNDAFPALDSDVYQTCKLQVSHVSAGPHRATQSEIAAICAVEPARSAHRPSVVPAEPRASHPFQDRCWAACLHGFKKEGVDGFPCLNACCCLVTRSLTGCEIAAADVVGACPPQGYDSSGENASGHSLGHGHIGGPPNAVAGASGTCVDGTACEGGASIQQGVELNSLRAPGGTGYQLAAMESVFDLVD